MSRVRATYSDVVWLSLDRILTGAAWAQTPDDERVTVRRLGDSTWRYNIAGEVFGPFATYDAALKDLDQQLLGRGWLLRLG